MKTIFLCENPNNLTRIFPDNIITYLSENAEFNGKCYNKEYVLNNKNEFSDTKYIFSTWGMPIFNEQEIEEIFPSLECIFYAAGTVRDFARPFLNRSIKVFSAWAANAIPVAEYTVSQIILSNKGFYKAASLASVGKYELSQQKFYNYPGNYGSKIGIIGAGMIGRLVIKMLKNYNLNIVVFDPFLPDDIAQELGVKKVSLEEIFLTCNVVSNHLANNAQTQGMLNKNLFEKMPDYATFLNTGRGAQVVEQDLIDVLKSRPDLTAVLDVTMPEPPMQDSEFYKLDNCILTPHIAGSSGDELKRMAEYMLNEFKNYTNNQPTHYEVTLEMLKTMA